MARVLDRRRAIQLRQLGRSYSQIKKVLNVSKSTLSLWLREYPLSKTQLRMLRDFSEVRIEKYRKTMQKKLENRLWNYYEEQKGKWLPLSEKELFIAGLFLYWGEGAKTNRNQIYINNTDPQVMKFALNWMVKCCNIPKHKIRVTLHLYSDMNIEQELKYWRRELCLPGQSFLKPYVKQSKRSRIDHKGFGHGTCGIGYFKTEIKERILMAIKAIADHYQKQISNL